MEPELEQTDPESQCPESQPQLEPKMQFLACNECSDRGEGLVWSLRGMRPKAMRTAEGVVEKILKLHFR